MNIRDAESWIMVAGNRAKKLWKMVEADFYKPDALQMMRVQDQILEPFKKTMMDRIDPMNAAKVDEALYGKGGY